MTSDELEQFIDALISSQQCSCSSDACPIDFGGKGNDN